MCVSASYPARSRVESRFSKMSLENKVIWGGIRKVKAFRGRNRECACHTACAACSHRGHRKSVYASMYTLSCHVLQVRSQPGRPGDMLDWLYLVELDWLYLVELDWFIFGFDLRNPRGPLTQVDMSRPIYAREWSTLVIFWLYSSTTIYRAEHILRRSSGQPLKSVRRSIPTRNGRGGDLRSRGGDLRSRGGDLRSRGGDLRNP